MSHFTVEQYIDVESFSDDEAMSFASVSELQELMTQSFDYDADTEDEDTDTDTDMPSAASVAMESSDEEVEEKEDYDAEDDEEDDDDVFGMDTSTPSEDSFCNEDQVYAMSQIEIDYLENMFRTVKYLNHEQIDDLKFRIGVSRRTIIDWFEKRRARFFYEKNHHITQSYALNRPGGKIGFVTNEATAYAN